MIWISVIVGSFLLGAMSAGRITLAIGPVVAAAFAAWVSAHEPKGYDMSGIEFVVAVFVAGFCLAAWGLGRGARMIHRRRGWGRVPPWNGALVVGLFVAATAHGVAYGNLPFSGGPAQVHYCGHTYLRGGAFPEHRPARSLRIPAVIGYRFFIKSVVGDDAGLQQAINAGSCPLELLRPAGGGSYRVYGIITGG